MTSDYSVRVCRYVSYDAQCGKRVAKSRKRIAGTPVPVTY
jgi:hypothetical protein